jgi:hypothetical protein
MKNIFKIASLVAAVTLTTACNDSFLERTPTHDLNEAAYWKKLADLEAYNNGIYNEAGNNTQYKFMVGFAHTAWDSNTKSVYPLEAMSDNFVTNDSNQTWASTVAAGLENIPTSVTGQNYGGWHWNLLRRINVMLENYQKVNANETQKNQYAGEALFFRAWFYLYMVQNYGDVPLFTKPLNTTSEELYGKRTPRKEVMAQVLKDINLACEYLPVSWGSKPNRVTKGAALALKSRIGLYEGTYRKYHSLGDSEEFLNACVDASEALTGMGYEIYNTGNPTKDYTVLFTSEDLANNKEVILYRKYAPDLFTHRMCGYIVSKRNGGTKDFVDDFLCLDDHDNDVDTPRIARPVGLSTEYSNDTPEQEFTNRDPRLAQTFLAPGTTASANTFGSSAMASKRFPRLGDMPNWPSLTGYHAIKFYTFEQDVKGYNKETQDYPLFRYAEVLLNLAEAKAELGTITQDDLDRTINKLRSRVAMPDLTMNPAMDPKYASLNISSLLVEIRRERRVELSFEHLRYQDIMRWAQGSKLKERVLGMRLEDADMNDPRYEGKVKKFGTTGGTNYVHVYFNQADGKQYIDAYGGTNYAADKRSFDPAKDYLRPIPQPAITNNTNIDQNPNW